ncbi:protoporphyrinogen oxidase [Cohnella cholangitidis]|uniref:Coproporphyrinogen III oxidase n=1 Tax=Cohnella cholangitidis TaxID=2598458 RepID=A0A7G5C5Q4_9BACL|nr:protoporphyrinogen oxidase [Cohnella cholangitidis]QMV44538.1 protoporphyrinogen oxidase [Cohnella cholangitidis]
MESSVRKIVVLGGGITGLSAAYYAKKKFEEERIPVEITILEKSDRLGGKIRTLHRDGFTIEKGPDSFLARKLPIIDLTRELGLEDELVATNPNAKTNYILRKGMLHPMPLGLVLGIPTAVTPFMKTRLISPAGKLRAALDFVLPRRKDEGDESLGGFIERRLGKEVLDNITEPLLAGIYAGDTQQLSMYATFPQFKQLEKKHRSLILGMLAGKKNPPQTSELPDIAKRSMFLTYKGGLVTLVDRLTDRLHPVRIFTGHGVMQLKREDRQYRLTLDNGTDIHADGLIMAIPAFEAAKLLMESPVMYGLGRIQYVSVANIALAYKKEHIRYPLNGSGFVVPRKEGRMITACTWSSSKWLHAAPPGAVLLRTYVGRSGAQEWVGLTDEELIDGVREDLRLTMGISGEPLFSEITRCHRSMPQYPVGHPDQLKKWRTYLAENKPGLILCGAGYGGVGIPDCVDQGKKAAEQMLGYLLK